ncbi:hypothetical protein CKM354_000005700 [Cercospora kikuchii]|uniref:ATP-grasp domain-containing protein n=1 Tax=Cercospora kikuchii TaxID=84275 RepID=A0A9P3FAP1_9PEZI|nr:uncharacterized protein CKM354_000005700 [Cercospora kikuchii]GIZ36587.1 hypothetical protein CKM354_000005700 [Cercospora kikuchii]
MSWLGIDSVTSHSARFECRWSQRDSFNSASHDATAFDNVDIFVQRLPQGSAVSWPEHYDSPRISVTSSTGRTKELQSQDLGSEHAREFLTNCLKAAYQDSEHRIVARLIVPRETGHITRADILAQRLLGCDVAQYVASFVKPLHYFQGSSSNYERLEGAFTTAAGAVLLSNSYMKAQARASSEEIQETTNQGDMLRLLDSELRNRLSIQWLTDSPFCKRRPTLALIEGGLFSPESGGTGGSIYEAAIALGIDLVVCDNSGHWVTAPKYRHWYKEFIPLQCPLHPGPDFASTIVKAVRSYEGHLDGILTFRDHYKWPTARAACELGLPSAPPAAYEIATDKFKTSVAAGHKAFVAKSAEEALQIVQNHKLSFPLITKPTNGFLSEGVSRVENIDELRVAAESVDVAERHGTEFVIEPYCDGPELDINMVLCDGVVCLFEVSDDFPKGGDSNGQAKVKSFIELANLLPSALPQSEQAIVQESLRKNLVDIGFSSGFFHVEARVENSSMEYTRGQDQILDLRARSPPLQPSSTPSCWLIEVNPRPPGIQASEAVRYTYGIDYFGLALLFALEDKQRAVQLSQAFADGPQYWCEMVFIPVEQGGTFDSGDVCEELFGRRPDLARQICGSFCFLKQGSKVADPAATGVNSWVAYFNVFSRHSRLDVLKIADEVRREVRFTIL